MRRGLIAAVAVVAVGAAFPAISWGAGPVHVVDRIKADTGDSVTMFANKDFKVTGKCEDNGGGDFTAHTLLAAKRKHLIYFRYSNSEFDANFSPSDGKVDATANDATGPDPKFEGAEYYDFWVEGRNGRPVMGRLATGVHLGSSDCSSRAR